MSNKTNRYSVFNVLNSAQVSDEMKLKRKISIRDLKEEQEDPRPSTSKDEEFSDMVTEKEESVSLGQKIVTGLLFVWAFIESFMNSLTLQLNNYSKDYRYVRRVLTREKKLLKVICFRYCYL